MLLASLLSTRESTTTNLHAASVIVHVGLLVSIFFHVTVTSFVVSPSVIVITHVSSPTLFALGVYVMLLLLILQLPLLPCVFTLALIVSQLHAAALLKSFQLTVLAVFHTFVLHVKLFAVNTTSVHVYVTVLVVTFHALSFTFTVTL